MKIYTKTGDKGTTGLFGGERVAKNHARIAAYGNLDELNSHLGVCSAVLEETGAEELLALRQKFEEIQHHIFVIGSHLATPSEKGKAQLPRIESVWIEDLEHAIDAMELELPELKNFILPAGSRAASLIHVARTVARRAERSIVDVHNQEAIDSLGMQYINRLSDFLFVSARYVNYALGFGDMLWQK